MSRVILAEKPDMGRKIADALGVRESKKGYIILNNGDIVTWAIGHIVQLKKPEAYEEYKTWSIDSLPIIPKKFELEVDTSKVQQFKIISSLVRNSSEVCVATDPGREGELIAIWILRLAGYKGPLKRLWIDDLTQATIIEGFKNLLDGKEKATLGYAAEIRARADYMIGFTATRLFSLLSQQNLGERATLTSGRVQTPTLKIVYDREIAIQQFKSEPFFEINAEFVISDGCSYLGKWYKINQDSKKETRFASKEQAIEVMNKLQHEGIIASYKEKIVKINPPQLFDSTSLKESARKSFGFGVDKTSKIAQKLYDEGYITYTRVSSRHLSENVADDLVLKLENLMQSGINQDLFPKNIKTLKGNKRFVDNSKAKEHHAIVVSSKLPNSLSGDEKSLYELILKQTLAAHHEPGKDKEVEITTQVGNETFFTKGVTVQEIGWRKILKPSINEILLPSVNENEKVKIQNIDLSQGKTEPPKRLTDDQLEKAMENAGKIIESEDDEINELLKEHGLGTPATRSSIIMKLKNQNYIELKKNNVYLTEKGKHFIEMLPGHALTQIEFTGKLEKKLLDVENRKEDPRSVLNEFIAFTHEIVNKKNQIVQTMIQLKDQSNHLFETNKIDSSCPQCGKSLIERDKFYGCKGYKEGCKFTLPKTFMGGKLTPKIISNLIDGKEVLVNCSGQYGTYPMYFSLKNNQITTKKPTIEDLSLGQCPSCGKEVIDKGKLYGCSGYKSGCKFSLSKTFLGKNITSTQIKKLLTKGETDLIKGLKGSKGNFDSKLVYDAEKNRYSFKK